MTQVPLRRRHPQRVTGGLGRPCGSVSHEQRQIQLADPFAEGPQEEVEVGGEPVGLAASLRLTFTIESPRQVLDIEDEIR
jgi:hypothetical protein